MEEVFLRLGVGNGIAVHSLSRCRVQFQPFETWQVKSPRVLRRDRVNAYAKQAVRQSLIDFDDISVNPGDVFQIVGITDSRQLCFLLVRG